MTDPVRLSRREFLPAAALGAAGLVAGPALPATDRLRVPDGGAVVVVTDAHIGVSPSANVDGLARLLERWTGDGSCVVFAGDFLDLWCAEDDAVWEAMQPVVPSVRALAAGRRLWIVPGNHDFRLRDEAHPPAPPTGRRLLLWRRYEQRCPRRFLGELGVGPAQVCHRHLAVESGGRHFIVTHGDETDFGFFAKKLIGLRGLYDVYRGVDTLDADLVLDIKRAARRVEQLLEAALKSAMEWAYDRLGCPRNAWLTEDAARPDWATVREEFMRPEAALLPGEGGQGPVGAEEPFARGLLQALEEIGEGKLPLPATDEDGEWRLALRPEALGVPLPEGFPEEKVRTGIGKCPAREVRKRLGPPADFDVPDAARADSVVAYQADSPGRFDYVVMGHRHVPQNWPSKGPLHAVVDAGAWERETLDKCTYAVICDGKAQQVPAKV